MCKYSICKISLLSLFFIVINDVQSVAQCSISDLVITNSDCDENDMFSIELNFDFSDPGMNGFQVLGNGANYGTFQYEDLPITIDGLIGNCDVEFEFIVRDVIDPTCAAFLDYGTVCCDDKCIIEVFDFETSECDDDLAYTLTLNLEYEFVGDEGYSVDINGEDFGNFSYEELPLILDNVTTSEDGLNVITICDNDVPDCCTSYSYLNPCFCGMSNVTSTIIECDETDSTFYTVINFDHVATNDSFQMGYSNGGTNIFLGTFAYQDLPVTAGPIFLSETDQEILIVDTEDFFCFSTAYLGIVDDCLIECQLFNVFAEAVMCEEGEYFMEIEFEGKDLQSSGFEVLIDGISYGNFEYGESLYSVGPIPSNCDSAPTVVIQDNGSELCSDFYNFPEPICCPLECNFTSLEVEVDCAIDIMTLNGVFENDGSMFSAFYFVQFQGTSYGPFLYGDFTFMIDVPLMANGEYEITINDSGDPECFLTTTILVQCEEEPCLIFNVNAEASECEGETFFVDVEFEFAGEVSDSFVIQGNGMNYGTFAYGDPFYTVGPLVGDCETLYEFVVSDQILEGCNSFYAFDEAICCTLPCSISELEIIDYECSDLLNISSFTLNFLYNNTPSEMFEISIDGLPVGTFNYADLPITVEINNGEIFTLIVEDSENSDCTTSADFDLDCSSTCVINQVSTEFIECTEEKDAYFVSLNFNFENTSSTFDLFNDEDLLGSFEYADLPVNVGPLLIDTEHNLEIIDSGSENCSNEIQVYLEQCETSLNDTEFVNLELNQYSNHINLTNNETVDLHLRVFSISGELMVNNVLIKGNSLKINTEDWTTGLYVLNLIGRNNQKTLKLFVY